MIDKTPFIKKLTRASKSPWSTDSTLLFLAQIETDSKGKQSIGFSRYIYVHRDEIGQILGIGISKSIAEAYPNLASRYLTGKEMYQVLCDYIVEIIEFVELFKDQFEAIFLMTVRNYFENANSVWLTKLQK